MENEDKKARQDRKLTRKCERQKMEIENLKAGKVEFTARMPDGTELSIKGTDYQVVEIASMLNKMFHKQQKALP